jgi:hypothetical protein
MLDEIDGVGKQVTAIEKNTLPTIRSYQTLASYAIVKLEFLPLENVLVDRPITFKD